jgi:hypothetical protein
VGVSMDKHAQVSALDMDRHGGLWCLIADQSRLGTAGSRDHLLAKSATLRYRHISGVEHAS